MSGRRTRCRCRIARSQRWPSGASSGRRAASESRRSARCSASCPATGTARTPISASGSRASSTRTRMRAKVVHRDSLAGSPRRCRADCARRAAERGQVVAAAGAVADPDQDRRLRLHDAPTRAGADADRRRARPARRDPGADRRRARGPRRRPGAARRPPERGRDRLLPRGERARRRRSTSCAREVAAAGIEKPAIVALTKADELTDEELERCGRARGSGVVAVSVLDDASLDRLREAIWALTGLIRVFSARRRSGRRRAVRAADRRDGRRRRGPRPPRARRGVHRRADLGRVGAVRRPACRARARGRGRRRRRGGDAVGRSLREPGVATDGRSAER